MKAPALAYLRVTGVDEALQALAQHGDEAAVLAGGQSLIPMLNLRVAGASVLVDINRIPGLGGIEVHEDHVRVGALTRYVDLERDGRVRRELPLLAQALPHVAHAAIRNRGTAGGSLALADPAAELPACALALDARVHVTGPGGAREVTSEHWFRGLYETDLALGEIVVGVSFPRARPDTAATFVELGRRQGDFAVVGAAIVGVRDGDRLRAPRIAMLGAGDRPLLARTLMQEVDGAVPASLKAGRITEALREDMAPLEDPAIPAGYRHAAMAVLLRRALEAL